MKNNNKNKQSYEKFKKGCKKPMTLKVGNFWLALIIISVVAVVAGVFVGQYEERNSNQIKANSEAKAEHYATMTTPELQDQMYRTLLTVLIAGMPFILIALLSGWIIHGIL